MRKPHADANKADPVIDALEAITGHEWRRRGHLYECRANNTHAKNIEADLLDHNIPVTKAVSTERSGRYFLTIPASDGQLVLNASGNMEKVGPHPFLPKKWRTDGKD